MELHKKKKQWNNFQLHEIMLHEINKIKSKHYYQNYLWIPQYSPEYYEIH